MIARRITITLCLLLWAVTSFATAWDEPWRKEIIKKSEYFVHGRVVHASDSVVTIHVLKSFGEALTDTITLDGFFLLDLCSVSGHGPHFSFKIDQEGYLFLKKGSNGNFKIPTPSSGFDRIVEDKVHATYRHSYHQAAIPKDIYELTYTAIWNKLHNGEVEEEAVRSFIQENLSKPPAGFDEVEIDLFYAQHAALETAYLLDISLDFDILKGFAESTNFHARVSAVRAMVNDKSDQAKAYLLETLTAEDSNNFISVIAIWTLWKMNDKKITKKLWKMKNQLSREKEGFGGNIMDNRICTHFPSPQSAITELKENKGMSEKLSNL